MTVEDAIQKISRQYQLSDIQVTDYQEGFKNFNPSDVKRLIEYFQETYEYNNAPKWAFFAKASYKLGIKKHRVELDKRRKYRKCLGGSMIDVKIDKNGNELKSFIPFTCNTNYSIKSGACPNCHSSYSEIIVMGEGKTLPDYVIETQEDCHRCKNFIMEHDKELDINVHGPTCPEYGKKDNVNDCGECLCKACCQRFKDYNENPKKYTADIKNTGIDPMNWIMNSKAFREHYHDRSRLNVKDIKKKKYKKPDFFGKLAEEIAKSKRLK